MANRSDAEPFAQYNAELAGQVAAVLDGSWVDTSSLALSLDGGCAQRLRELVPLPYRRKVGAFFTPARHRAALGPVLATLPPGPYLDPTCGAGDLLLTASSVLGVGSDLATTVDSWAPKLFGWDIHPEFIHAAQLRLLLAAASRSPNIARHNVLSLDSLALPGIQVADAAIRLPENRIEGTVVLMNPPYGSSTAPPGCTWAKGQVSRAALFVEQVLEVIDSRCHVVAILPDVLRTGARYERWRALIGRQSRISLIKPLGLFDEYTDVDVFLLVAQRLHNDRGAEHEKSLNQSANWWEPSENCNGTVGDHFSIRVGPVVDNRDPREGAEHPFVTARDLPQEGAAELPARTRKFTGQLFAPPFVLLRRTSRPTSSDISRAPGVLISGQQSAAIDNHLLVAFPRDGNEDTCRELLKVLRAEKTTRFLDQRLRCRHLTVGSVNEIPWI